jgi:UrcA family protein
MSKIALAALAVAMLAGPALAQETQSALVRTGRVDFNDPAQVQQVYQRVEAAARQVCTLTSDNRYVAVTDRECMRKAIADAIAQTNRPLLTAAYDASARSTNRALAGNDQ